MIGFLAVGFGGALGAMARHGVNVGVMKTLGPGFPVGTMVVNIVGSLAMGLLIGLMARHEFAGNGFRLFAATGFLGGFTTFSAFSLDAYVLFERGAIAAAAAYAIGSVVLAILALVAGFAIVRAGWIG